jgi:hypothetical protein
MLETEYDNAAALSLYASLGFLREKRLFRFYMSGKDAFRLVLPLIPPSSEHFPHGSVGLASHVEIDDAHDPSAGSGDNFASSSTRLRSISEEVTQGSRAELLHNSGFGPARTFSSTNLPSLSQPPNPHSALQSHIFVP